MNARAPRILLTGFMCAGKTTVARSLAARLGCDMLDTDAVVVEREGRSIEAIIDADGEARFRQLETGALRDALERRGDACVIALGGGAWTIEENRALIAAARDCLTVWLDAPFELCWRRISDAAGEHTRPLARERERAHALYTARRSTYALAALRVQASEGRSAEDTAAEIVSLIARQNFSDEHEGREGKKTIWLNTTRTPKP
ncbi:MAG TPA: shikimate kinase [Pyrinomonadaceae bacterium]|nr:shikimate kinase [Pyrinomonadaceae bacterium]